MNLATAFLTRLESKVEQQLGSQNVGYLIGAGASYLNDKGYPLAEKLWNRIATNIPKLERDEIQAKLDEGVDGLEKALDLLDDGSVIEKPHRHLVTEAIAEYFLSVIPPIDSHRVLVRRLALRQEINVPIFCINYDGLIEVAADAERVRVVDGFLGVESLFFEPCTFKECIALTHRGARRTQADWRKGTIYLYKLHGSLGWYHFGNDEVRRLGLWTKTPPGARRLMVPPQHRKATDTTAPPYSALWSDFRGRLCHGPNLLNRLVAIGYGMRDEHLNAVIENALGRTNLTLLVFAYELAPDVFTRWGEKRNVIIVTNTQCSLNGEIGPGHPNLWDSEKLMRRI